MRFAIWGGLLIFACLLASCVSPVPYRVSKTESGKPEAFIASTGVDEMKASLVRQMINLGYEIEKETQLTIEFKRNNGWSDSARNIVAAGGSKVEALGYTWVSYTLVASNRQTWIVADAKLFVRPPFGGPMTGVSLLGNNDGYDSLQIQLNALKTSIESAQKN
jgi:hypothetical protein